MCQTLGQVLGKKGKQEILDEFKVVRKVKKQSSNDIFNVIIQLQDNIKNSGESFVNFQFNQDLGMLSAIDIQK